MVKLALFIKGNFENIKSIRPDGSDFRWYMRFKCANCGEGTDSYQYFSQDEEMDLKGGRGAANLVMKCKLCSRENSISILGDTIKECKAEEDTEMKFQQVCAFDCRGLEPYDFSFRNGWDATSPTGTVFQDVDLSDDWTDFDEKSNSPRFVSRMKSLIKDELIFTASTQKEGAGFIVNRPIGGQNLSELDPFLLLDHMGPMECKPGEAVGAPDHPHRGFETVTYILDGGLEHKDSVGNTGILSKGWCQWMTAGSGVVHSEMPTQDVLKNGGKMEGFQLWVNLPAKDKMKPPRYQDTPPDHIPKVCFGKSSTITVLSGKYDNVTSPITPGVPVTYLDVTLKSEDTFEWTIPENQNGLVYCYQGKGTFNSIKNASKSIEFKSTIQLPQQTRFDVKSDDEVKFLVLSGTPVDEPIVRHGPFVMNTKEEIQQAFLDYQSGKLGSIPGHDERMRQTMLAKKEQQKNKHH